MKNAVIADALRAAADVFDSATDDNAATSTAHAATSSEPTLADRVSDFILNDNPSYTSRSVAAIAKGLGETESAIRAVIVNHLVRFSSRASRGGLGELVSVRD